MPDYLPRREGDRVAWAGHLARVQVARPWEYGVTALEAEEYRAQYEQAAEVWRLSRMPATRTGLAVQRKDAALAGLVRATRGMVRRVRGYLAASDQAGVRSNRLAAIGLRPASRSRRVLRLPGREPRVWVGPTLEGKIKVVVSDPARPASRAKPRGVQHVAVFVRVRSAATGQWSGWRYDTARTRMRFEMDYPTGARPGDRLAVAVKWCSPTGALGPASSPAELELGPRYTVRMTGSMARRAA